MIDVFRIAQIEAVGSNHVFSLDRVKLEQALDADCAERGTPKISTVALRVLKPLYRSQDLDSPLQGGD